MFEEIKKLKIGSELSDNFQLSSNYKKIKESYTNNLKITDSISRYMEMSNKMSEMSSRIAGVSRYEDLKESYTNNLKITDSISRYMEMSNKIAEMSSRIAGVSRYEDLKESYTNNLKITDSISRYMEMSNKIAEMSSRIAGVSRYEDLKKSYTNNLKITDSISRYMEMSNKMSEMSNRIIGISKYIEVPNSIKFNQSELLETINVINNSRKNNKKISSKIVYRKSNFKKINLIKLNENKNRDIVININFPYSTELIESLKEILKQLNYLKEDNKKFIIGCLVGLCVMFGKSLLSSLTEKISDEILRSSKQTIKKSIKIYKEMSSFGTFSNLAIITKKNVFLYSNNKKQQGIELDYGQVVTYEEIKGKYILIKFEKNNKLYEGIILKKYLKKLDK